KQRHILQMSFCSHCRLMVFRFGGEQYQPRGTWALLPLFQKSARMTCEIQILEANFDGTIIHWYKQKEGEAPERLLFFSGHKVTVERDLSLASKSERFFCGPCKESAVQEILISIVRLWDPDVKIFGSGTELIVSNKASSPPANSEILQKKLENQTTYVCLIEKFYPEVIRVTWTDDEKEVTDNVVKGDAWQSAKGDDDYSIASWLTVPAENKDKKYYCKYEHEEQQASLSTQGMFHLLKMDFDLLL
uniref:Ig-like domain-containing protein n=1 Tax=Ficedula albicollis TaxID=59894 RepID=A0A803W421_FICAL